MSSSIEEVSIPQLNEVDRKNRKQTPSLWKLPKVDKSDQKKLAELEQYQRMYTKILYHVGKSKYNLNKDSDFTVEVILPTENFSDLSYHIIAGPVCQLILTVCSTKEFEALLHPLLEMVKASVHNKYIDNIVKLKKRQDEIKKLIPPFMTYDLEDHHLEVKREQKITIFDPTTGITVTRTMPDESEPWRLMTHWAKMELIKLNKLVKEFESREVIENNGTFNENENKIPVGANSSLER